MDAERNGYRTIPDYPDYEINHRGDIRRLWRTTKPTNLKPSIKKKQYIIRLLSPEGQRKEERIHKLMQRTFFPPPKLGQVFYHKNGNRLDNWINNLAYICRYELGKATGAKSKRKPVAKLDRNGELIETYASAREAARENFMSYQTIIDRCNGKVKVKFAPDGSQYVWDDDYEY